MAKTATLPPIRVSEASKKNIEAHLFPGETLSAFVQAAVDHSLELRKADQDFVARGLASAKDADKTGRYVSTASVIKSLDGILKRAKMRKRSKAR